MNRINESSIKRILNILPTNLQNKKKIVGSFGVEVFSGKFFKFLGILQIFGQIDEQIRELKSFRHPEKHAPAQTG